MTTALLDCLTHHCDIVETGTKAAALRFFVSRLRAPRSGGLRFPWQADARSLLFVFINENDTFSLQRPGRVMRLRDKAHLMFVKNGHP